MRNKAFLACALVASALLAASGVMATGGGGTPTAAPSPPPTTCSTGLYQVAVASGPTFVSCTATGGQCTEIAYAVTSGGVPDHVAVVQGVGIWSVTGPGNQWYGPGVGDPVTGLGRFSSHEQAAKFNPTTSVLNFTIRLAGRRNPSPTAIATKKGTKFGSCRIVGIGLEAGPNPFQQVQRTETVNFKGCSVNFNYDATSGAFLGAELAPDSTGCDFYENNIDDLTLNLPGLTLTDGKFGEGYISSGTNSCTTRIIGGRVYTWGDPCPD
jgi:hypothetical protein